MDVRRIYASLLRLYPRSYRECFTKEMLAVFEQAAEEHSRQGLAAFARFLTAEIAGVLKGAVVEWSAGARESPAPCSAGEELAAAEARIDLLVRRIVHAIANHDFETARSCSCEEQRERENLRQLREKDTPGG
jgi:hypothetical protein